jgi:hypothetical protein
MTKPFCSIAGLKIQPASQNGHLPFLSLGISSLCVVCWGLLMGRGKNQKAKSLDMFTTFVEVF